MSTRKTNFSKEVFLAVQSVLAAVILSTAANAQSPQSPTLPAMFGEGAQSAESQGISPGISFVFYDPTSNSEAQSTKSTPSAATYGVTEALNLLDPDQSTTNGFSLTGAALFDDPAKAKADKYQKEAVDQTFGYANSHLSFSLGYTNVGKLFDADTSQSEGLTGDIEKKLVGEKGQNGLNAAFNFDQSGNKFGLSLASITDSLQNQHRLSETMSMERDFNKALSLSFQHTENAVDQFQQNSTSNNSNNVIHLAFAPTQTGFLLDLKSSQSLDNQGNQSNDLSLKVAQKFSALNLSSQFETASSDSSGSASDWMSQRFDANGMIEPGLTFSGYWAKKSSSDGSGNDQFDAMVQSAENKYVQLAAEYAMNRATEGNSSGKESLTAKITPGSVGPLGPLLLALSINNQQTPLLDGYQTYSASLSGQIVHDDGFNFGLAGAKYYLAYTSASAGGTYASNGHNTVHSARTLRLVSAPAGKNALTWTINEQQRLDQNGQPLETASDVEAKYIVSRHLSAAVAAMAQMAQPNGNFTDQNQQSGTLTWNQNATSSLIAQFVHSRYPSQNIASEDGYFATYSGTALAVKKMDLGLGEQVKRDFTGAPAFGTTGNLAYSWKTDDNNQVDLSSKLTDWRNCGYNNDYDMSVEAAGQINFQREF